VRKKPLFKRRTTPPPAARKFLLASLLSGLILLAMLAIVFIPRGLIYEPLPVLPRIAFELNTTGGTRVVVSAVSAVRPLSEFNGTYSRGTSLLASIDPLRTATNGTFSFSDVDGDGNLSVGDEFRVAYNGTEVLRVWYRPGRAIVGYWPTPP
jgi:hypothetical protein